LPFQDDLQLCASEAPLTGCDERKTSASWTMSNGRVQRASRSLPIVSFLLVLVLYAVLVTGYFFLVLHFLGGALRALFETNKTAYAFVALALIIGQGVLLEVLTRALLRFFQRWLNRG
jgi:membrane protease YdiL (CAAX protease family)